MLAVAIMRYWCNERHQVQSIYEFQGNCYKQMRRSKAFHIGFEDDVISCMRKTLCYEEEV